MVIASPTYYRLTAEFHGKAAHAGIRPEDGRSAIVAAARAIKDLELGHAHALRPADVALLVVRVFDVTVEREAPHPRRVRLGRVGLGQEGRAVRLAVQRDARHCRVLPEPARSNSAIVPPSLTPSWNSTTSRPS